jgi:hypothetical protein
MRDPRGTVILCDQLYPSLGGKWVIAGTYTHFRSSPGAMQVDLPPLNVYIRFQVEKAGEYDCELLLVHRAQPSNVPPIIRQLVRLKIGDPLTPCEMGCVLPSIRVRCPDGLQAVPDAKPIGIPLLLWLKVAGEDLASCPLNVIFPPIQGPSHAGDPSSEHEPGQGR